MEISEDLKNKINNSNVSEDDLRAFGESIQAYTTEHVLRMIPNLIDYLVKQSSHLKNLSDKFYSENPDFKNQKGIVAQTMQQVEAENPGEAHEKILSITAQRMRKNQGLKSEIPDQEFDLGKIDSNLGEL